MRAKQRSIEQSVASCDNALQKLFVGLSVSVNADDQDAIVSEYCKKIRAFFGVAGACYCKAVSADELLCISTDGPMAEDFAGTLLSTRQPSVFAGAINARRTIWENPIDSRQTPHSARSTPRAGLATPVIIAEKVHGVFGLFDKTAERFPPNTIADLDILMALLANRLETAHLSQQASHYRQRANNLMNLALDSTRSFRIPDFVQRFTARAAEMLGAGIAALVLFRGAKLESVFVHSDPPIDARGLEALRSRLSELALRPASQIPAGPAELAPDHPLSVALGSSHVALTPLTGSTGDLLGLLCLGGRQRQLAAEDRNLLQALVSHASLTLENFRLFSQIEQSKKQWVEDIDAISDFIVVHDRLHRILRVNRSLAAFIGSQPSHMIGEPMSALRSIASQATAALPCPFCQDASAPAEENIHLAKERAYLISTSRIRGATDDDWRTIHVLKDITDRREAERRYRELFDNIQEGLFFSTPDGRFLEVNDAMVRMLGYSTREELLQTNISNHLYLAPERRRRFLEAIAERGVLRNYEEPLRRKDGTILHTLQNIFAVRDAQGAIVQYRGLMLDVTEQKHFQAQLQRERDFNQKILNNTQSMILVLDTAGLISYANPRCFEAGYREKELLGHRLVQWVSPSHRSGFEAALETTANGQQVNNLELPLRRGDGSTGHFSVSLSQVRDEQNQVNSIVVVMTDITDATILQAKLAHSEKMATIGRLVSGVAHEINNPLAAIVGFTDLLIENPDVPESAKTDLQVILQESQRTKEIVQDLLSFARQAPARRLPVQVNAVLRQTIKLRGYDFSSHGVEVVENLDPGIPRVQGDAQQLQQVFLNILNNAYDAVRETGRPGKIEISSLRHGECVEVHVHDNGPGIANPDHIFDPFFTTKEVGQGTGLGLSICYGIVQAHGGEILCLNNTDSAGCTFVVKLPAASESIGATVPEASAEANA
ncbi:MAG TPA: PAS domain S-box protein [Candidatus Dormibacteraeota bacterium]|nr:PAS domain S-box protein [Candidatus Dormibacteraeota bacterium]